MAEVTPLFPGQTGLTPGRRAELERAPLAPEAHLEEAPVPSGLLAQLVERENAATPDADDLPPDDLPVDEEGSEAVEASAAATPMQAPADAAADAQPTEPDAVVALQAAIASFNPNDLASTDPDVREEAERQLRLLSQQAHLVDGVFGGVEAMLRSAFPQRLADRVVATFALPMHMEAQTASVADEASAHVAPVSMDQLPPASRPASGGGGGSGVIDGLARLPFTFLAAGGSMAMAALRKSAALAQNGVLAANAKVRQSSFDIIGRQVKSLHADIEREAQWLRSHGLESVVDEMKSSGHSFRDAVAGMERGGPLEKAGLQFKGLMADPHFRERYESLQQKINRFDGKLSQYVKGGAALGHDLEADAEKMCDSLHQATEGFPVQNKDGSFKLLSDRIREIAEKVREMINNLFKRLAPGRG